MSKYTYYNVNFDDKEDVPIRIDNYHILPDVFQFLCYCIQDKKVKDNAEIIDIDVSVYYYLLNNETLDYNIRINILSSKDYQEYLDTYNYREGFYDE